MSHTFNRNPEALATSKTTVQRRHRQSARPPHTDRRVTVNTPSVESLADQIASHRGALTAADLSRYISVSRVTVFKLAKRGAIPSFRVGSCVRFCPAAIARWLRERGG